MADPVGYLSRLAKGLRAYHGSPHDFDKFDLSKIGTGEGAQAYGHGLYFAENEGVAKGYRNSLSELGWVSPEIAAKYDPQTLDVIRHDMKRNTLSEIMAFNKQYADAAAETGRGSIMADVYNALRSGDVKPTGKMYEVDIHADPGKMLNWDRPMAEQPGIVQDIARNMDLSALKPGNRTRVLMEKWKAGAEQPHYPASGHDFYNALSDYGGKSTPELSRSLNQSGVPGIKYLDANSRGPSTIFNVGSPRADFGPYTPFTNEADAYKQIEKLRKLGFGDAELKIQRQPQTSNYVMFDPELIEILRKYAQGGYVRQPAGYLSRMN